MGVIFFENIALAPLALVGFLLPSKSASHPAQPSLSSRHPELLGVHTASLF
jgi:hypothetical protein